MKSTPKKQLHILLTGLMLTGLMICCLLRYWSFIRYPSGLPETQADSAAWRRFMDQIELWSFFSRQLGILLWQVGHLFFLHHYWKRCIRVRFLHWAGYFSAHILAVFSIVFIFILWDPSHWGNYTESLYFSLPPILINCFLYGILGIWNRIRGS